MALQLGDTAPDFKQDSTDGPISFHDWAGAVSYTHLTLPTILLV